MKAAAGMIGDQPLVASHPVYQYWARRYQLKVEALLWEPETVPDNFALEELKALLETHPAQWMIWESEPAPESVEKLEAIGVQSLVFAPSGNTPETSDWLTAMRRNIAHLAAISGE